MLLVMQRFWRVNCVICEGDVGTSMIRTDSEYKETVKRIKEQQKHIDGQRAHLKAEGLTPDQIKRVIDPIISFHLQFVEAVEYYERLKRGELDELRGLRGLGRSLIALRIACDQTQKQLAERLGVHDSQVSRDERNRYHGITVEHAYRIMEALSVQPKIRFELPIIPQKSQSAETGRP